MVRAQITREGVLNAIAEFDATGRASFLERYGFNGAVAPEQVTVTSDSH